MRLILTLLLAGGLLLTARAETSLQAANPPPAACLTVKDAVILGVVEGVTEFLPVSSTGHLIIATHLLGLETERPLVDQAGRTLWYKKPSPRHPGGVPMTVKLAADTYTVVIQAGAILAVLLLYWRQLLAMLLGLLGRDPAGRRLLRNLLCAFVPVAIVGLLLNNYISAHLFSIRTVIVGLVGGAALMLWVERWRKRHVAAGAADKEPADMYSSEALKIGFWQCLALWPGTSRSMVTIVGGYLANLSPAKAAEFSFIIGLPVLAGAAVVKGWQSGGAMLEVFGWSNVLLGIVVATICAAIAVKFLVGFLSRHGLFSFAVYRLVLAVVLAFLFYL